MTKWDLHQPPEYKGQRIASSHDKQRCSCGALATHDATYQRAPSHDQPYGSWQHVGCCEECAHRADLQGWPLAPWKIEPLPAYHDHLLAVGRWVKKRNKALRQQQQGRLC